MNTKKIILLFSLIASSLHGMNTRNDDSFHRWFTSTNHLISLRQYEKAHKTLVDLKKDIENQNYLTEENLNNYTAATALMRIDIRGILICNQFLSHFLLQINDHALVISEAIKEKKKIIKKADEEAKEWLQLKMYNSPAYTTKNLKLFVSQLKKLSFELSRNFLKKQPEDPKILISRLNLSTKKPVFSTAIQKSSDAPTFIKTTLQQIQQYIPKFEAAEKNIKILSDLR